MKSMLVILLILMMAAQPAGAQVSVRKVPTVDLGFSLGDAFGISASYFHNWKAGRNGKLEIGAGARIKTLVGKQLYYITAPARLTSGRTGPLVFFTENIRKNIDSLLVQSPATTSVNLAVEFGYNLSPKWYVAFNIDVVGFTFGKKFSDGLYIRDNNGTPGVNGHPTRFNLLLTSDNDLGSLASELYLRYRLSRNWAIHGGISFDFSEYTTDEKVQQVPSANDRFRYKSLGGMVGVTRMLK